MNKGSTRSGILGISSSRRGEMPQNVVVPERAPSPEGSFDKIKGRDSARSGVLDKTNAGINGGVAVKSTLFNSDRNITPSHKVSHIDYRGTLEAVDNPEKKDIQQVLSIGTNLGAFRTEKAEG